MSSELLRYEAVHICIPPSDASSGAELVLEGWVGAVNTKTRCQLILNKHQKQIETLPARLLIRKSTATGLVEFDAVGHSLVPGDEPVLTVDLVGASRNLQRRDSCRVGIGSTARYRNLNADSPEEPGAWHNAVVNEVSQGGASLQLQSGNLEVGQKLLVELTLSGVLFAVPAVVCRVGYRPDGKTGCCSLQFSDLAPRQQYSLGKAIAQAELKLLSTRLRVR
jgi:hypothetical protein